MRGRGPGKTTDSRLEFWGKDKSHRSGPRNMTGIIRVWRLDLGVWQGLEMDLKAGPR